MAFIIYPTLGGVAGTDEADAQSELKHAVLQGNLETQKTASEKLVPFPEVFAHVFSIASARRLLSIYVPRSRARLENRPAKKRSKTSALGMLQR
jgi:hypothetical protein